MIVCNVNKNIINLKNYSDNANFDLIKDLEYLLRKAKKGEIQAFVGTSITEENTIEHIKAGDWENRVNTIIGMISDLQYELLKKNNGDL